ncbi:MAG: phosphoglycolate phosphatase [Kiritimatiellia bacterium]|jgi:phosphoglycolate phosphatase
MRHYRHIIWDWNGTLLNDAWLCLDVMNNALRKRGLPELSETRYQEIFTFPLLEYYRQAGFTFETETFEEAGSEFMEEYDARRYECALQHGAEELLEALFAEECQQYVLSAYHHEGLTHILEHFGIHHHFKTIQGLDDIYARGKIKQGIQLAEVLGDQRPFALLIGDTLHDAEVAAAMEIDCVLIPGGNQPHEKLSTAKARMFDSLKDFHAEWQHSR